MELPEGADWHLHRLVFKGWATWTELGSILSHDDVLEMNSVIDALEKAEARARKT